MNETLEKCGAVSWWTATALEMHGLLLAALGAAGCVANLLQIWLVPRVRVWPINVRLFLVSIGIYALVIDIHSVARYFIYDRQYLGQLRSQGPRRMELTFCQLLEGFQAFAATPLGYFIPAIAVERWLIITDRTKASEHRPNTWVVGFLIGACLISFWTLSTMFFHQHPPSTCFCAFLVLSDPSMFVGVCSIFFVQEIFVLLFFRYVILLNRKKLTSFCLATSEHSLAERFDLRLTVGLTEMLLPSVVVQAVIWTLLVPVALWLVLFVDAASLTHSFSPPAAFGVLATIFAITLHATVHPLILFCRSSALKKKLKRALRRDSQLDVGLVDGNNLGIDWHFQIMNNIWEKHRDRTTAERTRLQMESSL